MAEERLKAVVEQISLDLDGADLKLSLFISCVSYKLNSCCVPFPKKFTLTDTKDLDKLGGVVQRIPPLKQIMDDNVTVAVDPDVLDILYWLFVELKGPRLKTLSRADHRRVLNLVQQEGRAVQPTHIFEIIYREDSTTETKFQQIKAEFESSYAFHGSKIFNFHSILHHGLHQHLSKNALFGDGLYLSSELDVSLLYSSNGTGWCNSQLGSKLSCVAFCEFVEHPLFTKRCTKARNNTTDLPEKYIIVSNNDIIRPRYLLVYASGAKPKTSDSLSSMVLNHKFLVVVYFLILVIIGLSDSRYAQYLKHIFARKLSSGI